MKDSIVENKIEYWCDNGPIYSIKTVVDGENHGDLTCFHFNGQLKYKGSFNKGRREGYFREWNHIGLLVGEEFYINGILTGIVKFFFNTTENILTLKTKKFMRYHGIQLKLLK